MLNDDHDRHHCPNESLLYSVAAVLVPQYW